MRREQAHEQPEAVKILRLFLQMTAAVGGLVLLFALETLVTAWSGCASATRSLRTCRTPAGRKAVYRRSLCRRALQVLYSESAGSWPEPAPVRAEVRVLSASGSRMKLFECSGGDR